MKKMKLLIQGAEGPADVPGIEEISDAVSVAYAPDGDALAVHLPGTDALLGWNFRARELETCWPLADCLRWIQWCGAGVDALLFPALCESNVILTNARGVFDRAMAEYVLSMILAQAKGLPETLASQAKAEWNYRVTQRVRGARVAIIGIGSIGREIAGMLQSFGLQVEGVGRTARDSVPVFGSVSAVSELHAVAARADWVVAVLPETSDTRGVFGTEFFAAMRPHARFINIGRGSAVHEPALISALRDGTIAGAALDVFDNEPLAADDALWQAPNIIISPHMSGDYFGHQSDLFAVFADNLARFQADQPLLNVVDKQAGFVTG